MKEYIEREAILKHKTLIPGFVGEYVSADRIKKARAADVVSRAAFDQVMWERDVAIQQLREDYGVGLGEKKAADVVERKHGEWALNKDGSGTCNQCHFTQKNVWDYDGWQNYCGVCGADMRGSENHAET